MSGKRYSDEFKVEAAKQVIDQGRSVREVSTRLGVSIDSMYAWVREQRKAPATRQVDASLAAENRRLQAELKRVTEERDILKKAAVSSTRRRNGLAQLSGWRLEAQGLTRSFVETSGDLVQECLRMAG